MNKSLAGNQTRRWDHCWPTIALALGFFSANAPAADPPSAPEATPNAQIVQVLVAGKAGVPASFDPSQLFSIGDFFYAVGPSRKPSIHYFKRDASSGLVECVGTVPAADQDYNSTASCTVGGRLYILLTHWANNAIDNKIVWFDIDNKTGKPEQKGITEKLTWNDRPGHSESTFWGRIIVAGIESKIIYVTTDRAILSFTIDADGKPVPAGQLADKAIGEYALATPDGKWLYTMTHKPAPAIACVECRPDGAMELKHVVKLDPKWAVPNTTTEFSMSMTPDGQWLYAGDWNGAGDEVDKADISTTNSYLAVLKRDPATGALKLDDSGCGNDSTRPDLKLANSRQLRLVFSPDGATGFVSTASGSVLRSFERNVNTGRIGPIAEFPEWDTRRLETRSLWLDAEKGFLYGASGRPFGHGANSVGLETHGMWVASVGKAREPRGPAIVPVLTADKVASGPAAAADWPHWHGPTGDLKSPMRPILKDWTNGLKKVWEVRGLSPGAHTWSMPAIQGNRLVVSGRHGFLDQFFCFDADRGGAPLWVAEIEGGEAGHFDWGSGSHAMASIDGDRVFVSDLQGIAAAISMADGKILWKKSLGGGMFTSSPLVYDDLVIYAGGSNYWHGFPTIALHKETGAVAWTYGQRCHSNSSPILAKINGRDQILHLEAKSLFGLDPRTGAALWTFQTRSMEEKNPEGGPIQTPLVDGNIIYSGWSDCPTVQVEGDSAKELWTRFTGAKTRIATSSGTAISDAVLIDGYMYHFVGNGSGYANAPQGSLVCTEFKTGIVQWMAGIGNGTLIVVDDCLLCLTYAGDLLLVDPTPAKFTKRTEIKAFVTRDPWINRQAAKLNESDKDHSNGDLDYAPCWAPPAVARGKLYIHYSNRLTCYDLTPP